MTEEPKFRYYTDQPDIRLREYGRNVHDIARHLLTLEDREERTRGAYTLIELMRQLHPLMRESQEYTQILWDHLFIITDFQLDVDSPFPMPEPDLLGRRPQRVAYPEGKIRYHHYGRNVQELIKRAIELKDEDEQRGAVIYLGKLMKTFYVTWNKDNVDDTVICRQIAELSNGQLRIDAEEVKADNLFDSNLRERNSFEKGETRSSSGGRKGGRRKSGGKSNNKSNKRNRNHNH